MSATSERHAEVDEKLTAHGSGYFAVSILLLCGFGWVSDDHDWREGFYLQPGEPTGLCEESKPGVFSRAWTAGVASLDCNTFKASLPFPSLKSAIEVAS